MFAHIHYTILASWMFLLFLNLDYQTASFLPFCLTVCFISESCVSSVVCFLVLMSDEDFWSWVYGASIPFLAGAICIMILISRYDMDHNTHKLTPYGPWYSDSPLCITIHFMFKKEEIFFFQTEQYNIAQFTLLIE